MFIPSFPRHPRSIAFAFKRLKPLIGRGSLLMHADFHGLNPDNYAFALNQMFIRPFPRHPRSIAFAVNRLKPEIGRGSLLMHADFHGLNPDNYAFALNQMFIRRFRVIRVPLLLPSTGLNLNGKWITSDARGFSRIKPKDHTY